MIPLIAYLVGRLARPARKGLWGFLEVILHIGAHRTGSSSLQKALQRNRQNLRKNGVAVWGPQDTRGGLFSGMLRQARPGDQARTRLIERNRGLIAIELERLKTRGIKTLLVSEENIIGSMIGNLRTGLLYPGLEARLAPFASVFRGHLCRVGLAIRPYGSYWASVLGYGLRTGRMLPDAEMLDHLAAQPRPWRRVVADVARAFPGSSVVVWEFDRLIGRPQAQYRLLTNGARGWIPPMAEKCNASMGRAELRTLLEARCMADRAAEIAPGDGPYQPFSAHHLVLFEEQYSTDLDWLRAQGGGGVRLDENNGPDGGQFIKRGFG